MIRQRKLELMESMTRAIVGDDVQLDKDENGRIVLPPETSAAHRAEIEKYQKFIFIRIQFDYNKT